MVELTPGPTQPSLFSLSRNPFLRSLKTRKQISTVQKTGNVSDDELSGSSQMNDVELFSRPQRFARVDRIVIILRGLPGSGKSTIAENIRKIEAKFSKKTKIFTWDEYFEEVKIQCHFTD